jgi:hypothetical protein
MRRLLATAVLALVASPVSAETIEIHLNTDISYGRLEFGSGPARIDGQAFLPEQGVELSVGERRFDVMSGELSMVTGPLVDVTPNGIDAAYTHDAGGWISIAFDVVLPGGTLHHGTFDAPLGVFVIYGDPTGGMAEGPLGQGSFDTATAQLFGIHRLTTAGAIYWFLDSVGDYPSPNRISHSFGDVIVNAVVPEPTTFALFVVAAAAIGWHRRSAC